MRKRIMRTAVLALCLSCFIAVTALADSSKVVTLGVNLSQEQKDTMFKYFGVEKNQVEVIEVNNTEERQYLEGVASEEVIGTRTYSCAYIEPTPSGGIQVKTANLTWVTSNMIASTLVTAGVTNCNVVAACPLEVSGTGALTGILKAYEKASDGELSEEKKQLATDELIQTGELGDVIGKDKALELINGVKMEVLEGEVVDPKEIQGIVESQAEKASVTLDESQTAALTALMEKIAAQDYDFDSLKETLNRVENNVSDTLKETVEEQKSFFGKLWDSIKDFFSGLFGGGDKETEPETLAPDNILNNTKDEVLGDVVSDATSTDALPPKETEELEQTEPTEQTSVSAEGQTQSLDTQETGMTQENTQSQDGAQETGTSQDAGQGTQETDMPQDAGKGTRETDMPQDAVQGTQETDMPQDAVQGTQETDMPQDAGQGAQENGMDQETVTQGTETVSQTEIQEAGTDIKEGNIFERFLNWLKGLFQ